MGWRDLNFEHEYFFEGKFKRKPRQWSISDIHTLWLKLKDRSSKRNNDFLEYLHWVVENIPPNDGKKWMIFFSDKSFYVLEKDHWNRISYGVQHVGNNRNSKIDSVITYSNTIEIGKKLKGLEKMKSFLDWKVKSHLDRIIYSKIRSPFSYNDDDKFIRIEGKLYLYKYTIRASEAKIITEIKDEKIINL
jgi:hypothetical protein